MLAKSYQNLGETKLAMQIYLACMQSNPLFLRLWKIPLPVTIKNVAANDPHKFSKLISKSALLDISKQGLKLQLNSDAKHVELCLADDYQTLVRCARQNLDEKTNAKMLTAKLLSDLFSPPIDLTQVDVSSLNGSPNKASGSEAIKDLLQDK